MLIEEILLKLKYNWNGLKRSIVATLLHLHVVDEKLRRHGEELLLRVEPHEWRPFCGKFFRHIAYVAPNFPGIESAKN